MRKLLPVILLFLVFGCLGVQKVEVVYYCTSEHPYCKIVDKYLDEIKFLSIDYCNVRDFNNCSKNAKDFAGYIYVLPTLVVENKSFSGLFGFMDFLDYLKSKGYKVYKPTLKEIVNDIEEVVKTYNKTEERDEFLRYLVEFKNNISDKNRIYFFYSPTCPHCVEVKPYVESLANKTTVVFCDITKFQNCSGDAKIVVTLSGLKGVPTAVIVNLTQVKVLIGSKEVKNLKKFI